MELSVCCDARSAQELFEMTGFCNDCLEPTMFYRDQQGVGMWYEQGFIDQYKFIEQLIENFEEEHDRKPTQEELDKEIEIRSK